MSIRDLLSALPPVEAKSAVDLGCGPGNSTELLAGTCIIPVVYIRHVAANLRQAHTYHHPLRGGAAAIVEWFKGSGLRPYLQPLDADQREAYLERYTAEVGRAYRTFAGGEVPLPFPRLFIVAVR